MKIFAKSVALTVAGLGVIGLSGSNSLAQAPTVSLDPFYEKAAKLAPNGMLGQILSKESIARTIAGADAWRIAYVSSDTHERKTVVGFVALAPQDVAAVAPHGADAVKDYAALAGGFTRP